MRISSRRISVALLIALSLSLLLSGLFDRNNVGMVRRGDFPAFYAAATLVTSDKGEQLYNRNRQREIENAHWPSLQGEYYAFAYPAPFAFFLSPLAKFSPLHAKLIFLGMQILFLALALVLFRERELLFRNHGLEAFTLVVTFAPLLVGVVAGQGAALNLLILLLVMGALENNERWEQEVLLGAVIGFWMYKPQLAVIALALCLCSGRPLAIFSGWLLSSLGMYFSGALVAGDLWPLLWIRQVLAFGREDFAVNGFQMISLFGVGGSLSKLFTASRGTGELIGMAASGLLFLLACGKIFRSHEPRKTAALLLGPAILLCSGHVLFYEAALVLPALWAQFRGPKKILFLSLINLAAFACSFGKEYFSFQPLILLPLAVFFFLLFQTKTKLLDPT